MKKISVVTINLNMKQGLEKSIKSLISQNEKDSVEYIVIDGLSTDGSQDVIDQYRDYIDVVKIEKDMGIFDAMNKGIELATGEYVYFLNSGDEFASGDVLSMVMKEMRSDNSVNSIYSGDVATFRFGEFIGIANLYPWIAHQSAFVKATLMKEYKFDSKFKVFGDLDFWRRLDGDKKYEYKKINKVIASMELDGVGSNPRFILTRLKDKRYYAKKHRDYGRLLGSYVVGIFGYLVYIIFGEYVFHNVYSKNVQEVKGKIRSYFAIN